MKKLSILPVLAVLVTFGTVTTMTYAGDAPSPTGRRESIKPRLVRRLSNVKKRTTLGRVISSPTGISHPRCNLRRADASLAYPPTMCRGVLAGAAEPRVDYTVTAS